MQGLTKRQREIVDFIEAYVNDHRHSPSYRDIQKHFGFSSLGSVYNHIQILKKKGIINKETTQARSLSLSSNNKSTAKVEVPFIGKLRAGLPIETFPQVLMIPIPPQMIPTEGEHYLLQIEGDALMEELMLEGDFLLVQPRSHFEEGEMVIVLVDGHTTFVKRVYSDTSYLRFESQNSQVQPLILRKDHVQIQGAVVCLLRHYIVDSKIIYSS